MKFYENPEDYDNRNLSLEPEERFKWYDCDEEMTKLSRLLPDVTLKLHVEGEEAGDITDRYFKNGKHCSYEAKIPDFNPADLE